MFSVGANMSASRGRPDRHRPRAAGRPQPAAAASSAGPGLPGNNQNMLALIATEAQRRWRAAPDPATTFTNIRLSRSAASSQRAKAMSDQDGALLDHLTQPARVGLWRLARRGDGQADRAQRAFEAVSKVIPPPTA